MTRTRSTQRWRRLDKGEFVTAKDSFVRSVSRLGCRVVGLVEWSGDIGLMRGGRGGGGFRVTVVAMYVHISTVHCPSRTCVAA